MIMKLFKVALALPILLIFILSTLAEGKRSRTLEDSCTQNDYHYEFTDCDSDGGRWLVSVPNLETCEGTLPQVPPRRLKECFKSCEAGQFLNLMSLECEDCAAGTYSLGGGVVFDEWDRLPPGFKIQVEKFRSMFASIGRQYTDVNCTKWGWRPRRDVILSQGGPCVASLTYTTQLVKPGKLKFTYQYADDSVLFQFQANSDQCESLREAEASRWPPLTGDGIWRTEEIDLHTGLNVFQWKTMGIDSHRPKPIIIKRIEIEGVGYTSSCNPCPGGYYSDKRAAKVCLPCPENHFSNHQSTSCQPCDRENFYSEIGSKECTLRPACTVADYYQVHKPCRNNQTQVLYKWVQPKICLESRPGATYLPEPGKLVKCPPCNPGTEYQNESCRACAPQEFSDGVSPCSQCPPLTQPNRGHHLTQWYSWPENGLHVSCITPEDTGCNNSPPWELYGNYTQTGKGQAKWVYLVLTLTVAGFRGMGGIVNGELLEVGRIIFSFEMKCAHDCELLFMQGTSTKNASVIQRWIGSQAFQEYSQPIYRNDTYDFSWAFQKLGWDSLADESLALGTNDMSGIDRSSTADDDNWVKIFQIHVQNSIDGGADSCVPCRDVVLRNRINDATSSCVACNPMNKLSDESSLRMRKNISTPSTAKGNADSMPEDCMPCPEGHIRIDPFSADSSSCRPCGPGLITKNGFQCTTDCVVHLEGHTYDLRPLKGFYTVRGSSLFTASGTQYYHTFNISLCMEQTAHCYKNVSLQQGVDSSNSRVEAFVCQSTIFPPAVGLSMESKSNSTTYGYSDMIAKPLSTHAASLGDHLVGISRTPSILGISVTDGIQNYMAHPHQFHFFYSTPERTIACAKGRSSTITFRCRPPSSSWSMESNGKYTERSEIRTPDKCPDGTCDGCNYHFIWETPFACHLCDEHELTIVKGECKDGLQEVHYLPYTNSQCLAKINSTWPTSQKCRNHLPLFAEVAIQLTIGLTAVLFIVLICFWRRHRKLEYKYMKLMASGSSGPKNSNDNYDEAHHSEHNMMPVAESCALDPNEDEDEEEIFNGTSRMEANHGRQSKEVSFYSDSALKNLVSKISILDKIKTLTRKGDATTTNHEIMNLTDKEEYS